MTLEVAAPIATAAISLIVSCVVAFWQTKTQAEQNKLQAEQNKLQAEQNKLQAEQNKLQAEYQALDSEMRELEKSAHRAGLGAIEIQLRTAVEEARARLEDISIEAFRDAVRTPEERRTDLQTAIHSAYERMVNALDLGCGLYLDGKVDKERFRRQYYAEVRNVFTEDTPMKKAATDMGTPYHALRKVYDEWENREK